MSMSMLPFGATRNGLALLLTVSAAFGVTSFTAAAQFMADKACAVQPEGAATNILALSATCGSATFKVDAALRRLGDLRIAADSNIYVRKVSLVYGSATGGTTERTEIQWHRLLGGGETTQAFPATRSGLGLLSVTVDVNPTGYGSERVQLALAGASVGEQMPQSSSAQAKLTTAPQSLADWVLIGSTVAHLTLLRDTVAIGRGKGRFDGLVISSRVNDLPVQSVVVVPVNGPAFSADLRTMLAPGALSGVITVDPPDFLHEVIVTYAASPVQLRIPTLEIRGHYAESWVGRVGENRQYAGGWILLGTADVVVGSHASAKRDGYRVAGQDGPFKKLRFVARRGAVDLADVTVDAGDGRQETVPVNAVLVPDAQSAPVTFASGPLPLRSVIISPRLRTNSRLDASVEVWAQY